MPLSIEPLLPVLVTRLASDPRIIVHAPPGAGKTTLVPLALLRAPWLAGRIVMLEPRRLAARAAAHRMAALLGETVGATVGYRMRGDTRVSASTRIEVVTEGVLPRMIATDPSLGGIGAVIFDEFHERSLAADLGLALTLRTGALLREDLRLIVMSATLDGASVSRLLGDAPVLTSEGRSFDVETRYLSRRTDARVEALASDAVRRALTDDDGDILVFLPGGAEIRRVEALIRGDGLPAGTDLRPLHGSMPAREQDAAIAPSPPGRRKVVLATSIAQTSLTIDGVRVVIDGGWSRVPRFSPKSGMTRLDTVRVSRASAEQRRGRAGRTAPGVCYRLWSDGEQASLPVRDTPEILEADLASLALDLAAAGVADPLELAWSDPPPTQAYRRARELLSQLDALDGEGWPTARGSRMAALPLHPRLAHMAIVAEAAGAGTAACDLAALLGDRDVIRGIAGPPPADVRLRLDAIRQAGSAGGEPVHGYSVDRDALRRVRAESEMLGRAIRPGPEWSDAESAGPLLALAYPDRIAQRRPGGAGRYLLRSGAGAVLPPGDALHDSEYLAIAETDGRKPESRITLAAPISRADIDELMEKQIEHERVVEWDRVAGAVSGSRRERLGAIVLREVPDHLADPAAMAAAFAAGVAAEGIEALPWSAGARRLRERVAFLRQLDASWPDWSDAALAATIGAWLAPHLTGLRRREQLNGLDLGALLMNTLPWTQRGDLDELAPTHVAVPSGSRIAIDYADPAAPVLAVRLQEMFGLQQTPRVGGNRVPLTVHLLSPAGRPVQVTRDLAGFWRGAYFDVKKDLKGRYPRHYWPDDPLVAEPTRRVRKRDPS